MIIIKKLRWSNAFSYGENNEIDFSKNPLTQIVGYNGYGKSSIALILEETLYNKNSKGIKKADILNRNTSAKSYTAELELEKDGDTYLIKTTRGSTQTVRIYKNGEDVSAHTATANYALIQDLLGYDHKTFAQIVYQSSASSLEFLTATDGNRKKFLIDLLNLTKYVEAGESFKESLKEITDKITILSTKIQTTSDWINKYKDFQLEEIALLDVPEQPMDIVEEIANLNTKISSASSVNKKIVQNNKYKQMLDSIVFDSTVIKPEIDENTKEKEAMLKKTVQDEEAFVTKMQRLGTNCPTCLQQIDKHSHSSLIEAHTAKKEIALSELHHIQKVLEKYNKELALWKKEEQLKTDYEKYYALYNKELESSVIDVNDLESKVSILEKELASISTSIKKVNEHNSKATSHNAKIEVIKSQLEENTKLVDKYKDELSGISKRQGIFQILVKTFSPTGLIAYKIECLIKDLEEVTNKYLLELSGGRFQLFFKVSSDKLNVVINDNGKDIEITALSGGERARVNVAALLGIRKLMQSLSNNRINLLILDETIENLDLDGKEKLVEVLLNEEYLNTFIISHSFTHPLLERIYITKSNNISRIE